MIPACPNQEFIPLSGTIFAVFHYENQHNSISIFIILLKKILIFNNF